MGNAVVREAPASTFSRGRLAHLLRPTFPDLFLIACLLGSVVTGSRMISADGDPARHITVGEQMLSTHRILNTDVFSYTKGGEPFVPYEWLAEVISAASY